MIENIASSTMTQKIEFDHRARRELADAFGAAVDLKPLEAADGGDHGAEHRRLDHAGVEVPGPHRVAQPLEELHEGEIEIEGAGDGTAQQAGHVAPEGEQRHGDHQGHDARHDQPFDRVEPHRAHGVDFLVDLHGADLGGEGAAGAARHDDGGEQNAQLAEHADADRFHGEGLGAELPELLDALVGDHHADQEAQHAHDHQRPDPDLVHLAHHGADAKAARLQAGLDEDKEDLAEEFAEIDALMIEIDRVASDFLEPMGKPVDVLLGRRFAHVVLHDLENVGMGLVGGLDLGVEPPPASVRISSAPAVSSRSTRSHRRGVRPLPSPAACCAFSAFCRMPRRLNTVHAPPTSMTGFPACTV